MQSLQCIGQEQDPGTACGLTSLPVETGPGNYFISNYPPYSTWQPELVSELDKVLAKPPVQAVPLSLYVHVPFCRHRCRYCYFRVYEQRPRGEVDAYLKLVLQELAHYIEQPVIGGRPLQSVYFGGGTPSYLSARQIEQLLGGLQKIAPWKAVEECTFECEPGTVTREKLKVLKDLGVTRITLGFQSLDDKILKANGRKTRATECLRAYEWVRELAFKEVNLDLMAGMPGETDESWQKTIAKTVELKPDCSTIYQLELTYNSKLYDDIQKGLGVPLADWPTKRRWLGEALRMYEDAGYVIGSGYMAIRDPKTWRLVYTLEHFWHGADLIGVGESAFGHLQGVHYQNIDNTEQYGSMLAAGRRPVRRARPLSDEEKFRREVVLQLKTAALDAAYFRAKFGVELSVKFQEQFERLSKAGLLEVEGDAIRLTREGLLQVDWLLPNFYLPEHVGIRYT